MKRKLLCLLLAFVGLGSIAGCESALEEDPRGLLAPSQFFNSPSEAEQAVIGIYDHFYPSSGTRSFWAQWGAFGRWGTDLFHSAARIQSKNSYLLTYTMNPSNVQSLVGAWRGYYRAVGDANLAVSRISAMENIEPDFQAQLIGEAKFMRALFYYYLTNIWGGVPMWLGELDVKEVRNLPRTPVDEVRAQIVKDLQDAEQVLPGTYGPSDVGRATKWAAKTLMLKTYMQMKNWPDARGKAKEIIDTSPHRLLDSHCAVFDHSNEFNNEIIFSVNYVKTPRRLSGPLAAYFTPRQQDEPEIPGVNMGGFGFYILYPSFANSFAENDLRKSCSIAREIKGTDLNWIYMPKWWDINNPRARRDYNFIFLRLADVYLMLAEAENEVSGPTPLAYDAINAVRTRAGLDPLSGLGQQQFREALRQERAWELAGEGHRRWDLIRWGKLVEAVRSIDDFELNPKAAANIQPHHVLFPIPAQVIAKNPNLTQNPGY